MPWKYGFKSIKSILRIRFVKRQPPTTWNRRQPDEYGFYANVNPRASHHRLSQKHHRWLDQFFALGAILEDIVQRPTSQRA